MRIGMQSICHLVKPTLRRLLIQILHKSCIVKALGLCLPMHKLRNFPDTPITLYLD